MLRMAGGRLSFVFIVVGFLMLLNTERGGSQCARGPSVFDYLPL